MREQIRNGVLIASTSFALWLSSVFLHKTFMPSLKVAEGIDLIYLPSGIRLLLLLIGGVAAAVGVAFANLALVEAELGIGDPALFTLTAVYTAFTPLFSLWLTMRFLGVDRSLKVLSARQMPWICLGTAVGSSVLHSIYFSFTHPRPPLEILSGTLAMSFGDFVGSFLVVVALCMLIRAVRWMF